tara:strand:- start:3237 stop:3593 length:357 start_codon:yes stop_codon:yes gene_type:complete
LQPGTGVLYQNPQFINIETFNFDVAGTSPCINSGSPDIIDDDGTISDIGAYFTSNLPCSNQGDLNNDNTINILDITLAVCVILDDSFDNCNTQCGWDMNSDGLYNIIDIILIIDIIIN